jgi:hypothetical protein
VAPSWGRAEEIVNRLRADGGREPLTLAQTGGEGVVAQTVTDVLGRLGWSHRPLSTDRDHPSHLGQAESPPPPDHGERMAPVPDSDEQERAAHEAASAEAERKAGR